jgi:hypothetical protein
MQWFPNLPWTLPWKVRKWGPQFMLFCFLGIVVLQILNTLIPSLFCHSFTIAHVMNNHTGDDSEWWIIKDLKGSCLGYSCHLPGDTEENHEKPQANEPQLWHLVTHAWPGHHYAVPPVLFRSGINLLSIQVTECTPSLTVKELCILPKQFISGFVGIWD